MFNPFCPKALLIRHTLCVVFSLLFGVGSATLYAQTDSLTLLQDARVSIEYLCGEELQGRGVSSEGEKKAAYWIAQQFQKIGLKAYNENYIQAFQLKSVNTFPTKIKLKADETNFTLGKDYLVASFSQRGKGTAKIIELDSSFFQDDTQRKEFLSKSLKNKALLYDEKWTQYIQLEYPDFLEKAQEAKAILLRQRKLVGVPSPRAYSIPYFEVLDSVFPKKVDKIKFRVKNKLVENYTSQNVIGYVKGTKKPNKAVVFTAHYDHLGAMGKNQLYFAGANDNAAGVAMLLELAKYYVKNPAEYSIVFIAFGAEEIGLLGSLYYTKRPLFPLSDIRFLINLDLIGTGEEGATFVNATVFEEEFQQLQVLNQQKNYLPALMQRGEASNSDHYFFHKNGVPSLFVYLNGGSQAYHDLNDRPENLSLKGYFGLYNLLIDFVEGL